MHTTDIRDNGQVLPLVVVAVLALTAAVLVVVAVAGAVHDRQRAQAAADATALAGALGGEGEAIQVAEANDAELLSFDETPDGVVVSVRVGDRQASARAAVSSAPRPRFRALVRDETPHLVDSSTVPGSDEQ